MVRCEYLVTYPDFLQSMRMYRHISKRAAIGYYLYVWVLPILGAMVFLVWLAALVRGEYDFGGALFWCACVGLGIALGLPARYRQSLHHAFKQRNVLTQDRPMACEFDATRVRFLVPGGTEISYPWENFSHFRENDQVAVLFIQQAAFHTIPKRAMGEPEWEEFRSYLKPQTRNA